MKALILAAGFGTRLRPITENIPKPLVLIGDKPLLWYHLESLKKYGFNDVLINTHYLSSQIDDYISGYIKLNPTMNIATVYEKVLLGSAGTLKNNYDFFKNEQDFAIIYGDNLTNINYKKIYQYHLKSKCLITIASYYEKYPESKGIIVYDDKKIIKQFIEKPKTEQVVSNYANGGVYIANSKIFNYLNELNYSPIDFGKDVFPYLLEKKENMTVYEMDEFLLDIGTLESYKKAQNKIKELIF